jgi:hypothetical protein
LKKSKYISLSIAAVIFFWAAWQTRSRLPAGPAGARTSAQIEKAPPLVVLTTVALGGFRGLIVDVLWMRLIGLQNEGKVFEIAQLADWITKLEPQFTSVWIFHAWNMAYNISILFPNPEHRWLWVKNGIQMLRDSALKYNPHDPAVYRELGWFYQHKIGQTMDDTHLYYKVKLAGEMNALFDGPRPDYAQNNGPRLRRAREEYKLYPEIMRAIEDEYGPLDWRLPETHAIYWAFRGIKSAVTGKNAETRERFAHPAETGKGACACHQAAQTVNTEKDTSACDHMIFQCMAEAFRQGRLWFDPEKGIYLTTPRLDLLPGALKAYRNAINRQATDDFKLAYLNFLGEAVFILHAYGDDETARELFARMLAQAPQLRRQTTFDRFLARCGELNIAELPVAYAIARIEGLLYRSYLPAADRKQAAELRAKARELWNQYNGRNRNPREPIPPFELLDRQAELDRAPRAERALKEKEGKND